MPVCYQDHCRVPMAVPIVLRGLEGYPHPPACPAHDLMYGPAVRHIEEDEKVDRPIALILAVVALKLARLGQDRLSHLTDELGRAFIEADHWVLRIGRL